MYRELHYAAPSPRLAASRGARALAAAVLRSASALLARLAGAVAGAAAEAVPAREPVIEFHAEAGAPEGALFVDGKRVGVLPGVSRL
ncbi:MAG: hypothetical protein KIT17_03715 [Rubrivivax sp.]|nr:hypothetical protein [Rubrivivax sp.]